MTLETVASPPTPAADFGLAPRCGTLIIKRRLLLPRRSIEKNGPLAQFVGRARRGGFAMDLWLVLAATADPGNATVIAKYAKLAYAVTGNKGDLSSDAARAKVTRTLKVLEKQGLVRLARLGRVTVISVRALDGTGGDYTLPRGTAGAFIALPSGYFANGWHHELSVPAKAMLLIALAEENRQWVQFSGGKFVAGGDALAKRYGIARSTIEKAKTELAHRGLLRYNPEPKELVDGDRLPLTLFEIDLSVLDTQPEEAPRYVSFPTTFTVTAPTGARLRRRRHQWVALPKDMPKLKGGDATPKRPKN